VAISFYAHDTRISVRSGSIDIRVRKLNIAVALLEPSFRKWRIEINIGKCRTTLFSRRLHHYRHSPCPVTISDECIAWTSETKYLGVTLESKLTYKTLILRKANNRLRQMFPILNKSSIVNINVGLIIYKSLLRYILTYASHMGLCCQNLHGQTADISQ
jgi:hypothetical protein